MNSQGVRLFVLLVIGAVALRSEAQWSGGNSTTAPINRTGNVGIGTSGAPSSILEVYGANPILKVTQSPGVGSSLLMLNQAAGAGNTSGIALRGGSPYIYNDSANASVILFGADLVAANAKVFFNVSTGNVGIGTANPGQKLDVAGSARFGTDFSTMPGPQYGGVMIGQYGGGAIGELQFLSAASSTGFGYRFMGDASNGGFKIQSRANSLSWTDFIQFANNNMGIGTATPAFPLTVAGTIFSSAGGFRFPDGTTQTTAATGASTLSAANVSAGAFGANSGGGNYSFAGNVSIDSSNPTVLTMGSTSHNAAINSPASFFLNLDSTDQYADLTGFVVGKNRSGITGGATLFSVMENGNVGIGSAQPTTSSAKLEVDGAIKGNSHLAFMPWVNVTTAWVNGYVLLRTPIAENESNMFSLHIFGYRYNDPGNEAMDIRCSGYAYTLWGLIHKACTTTGTDLPVEITTEPTNGTNYVVVRIGNLDTSWYYGHFSVEYDGWQPHAPSGFVWSVSSAVPQGAPAFNNMNTVSVMPADGGSVVIGQQGGPQATRLTVNGDAVVHGTLTGASVIGAVFQDLAEWVPASGDVPAGTVVILNPEKNNEVMPSSVAYDTRVAGVVSARPGLLLGVAGASKAKIATTGRVKVRVNATKHAIHIGDLLVTGGTSGARFM